MRLLLGNGKINVKCGAPDGAEKAARRAEGGGGHLAFSDRNAVASAIALPVRAERQWLCMKL